MDRPAASATSAVVGWAMARPSAVTTSGTDSGPTEAASSRRRPVVMCTAKGEEIDRVVGFEVGADDYVVKPYSVRELILRIRALLRRSHRVEGEP